MEAEAITGTAWAQEFKATMSHDCDTALQPGDRVKSCVKKEKKKILYVIIILWLSLLSNGYLVIQRREYP